jgi:flagellar protein FliS
MRQNLKAYKAVNIDSNILGADPHQLIVMMFNGALQSIAIAKGAIERKDLELKSQSVTKFINILTALRTSLDFDAEPVISKHFDDLYIYCIARMNEISLSLDVSGISEVTELLSPLRDAWSEMTEEAKQEGHNMLRDKEKLTQGA